MYNIVIFYISFFLFHAGLKIEQNIKTRICFKVISCFNIINDETI